MSDELAAYARRIETLWSDRLDRTSVFSPKEFSLIERWHAAGVPVSIIEEAIDETLEVRPGRVRKPPRRLSALEPSIEQAWMVVKQGRLGSEASPRDSGMDRSCGSNSVEAWQDARMAGDAGWANWLDKLLGRLDLGEPADGVEQALESELIARAPDRTVQACRLEVEEELTPHRARMSDAVFRRTRDRAWIDCVRRRIGLPRLGVTR